MPLFVVEIPEIHKTTLYIRADDWEKALVEGERILDDASYGRLKNVDFSERTEYESTLRSEDWSVEPIEDYKHLDQELIADNDVVPV